MRRVVAACAILVLALAGVGPARDALLADAPRTPLSSAAGTEGLAGTVLAGSFRPLLLTYLWLRGDVLYGEGRDEECFELYRLLYRLYPENERAREFVGWFLAFNLKRKAPDPAIGWQWAQAGLDMLVGCPDGPSVTADWIRKQCGQNSLVLQRYAGPEWREERLYRAGLRRFGVRRFGEDLSRFALGVRVLEGRGKFSDRIRRALLLWNLAYEELLRYGEAAHAEEAVAELRALAKELTDDEGLASYFEERARCLATAAGGGVPDPLPVPQTYPVAMALLGRGIKEGNEEPLGKAEALLAALGPEFGEEIGLVRRWRAHVRAPDASERPPFPFDGMP
ncbi:MAG TPA: hypothetical protein VFY93_08705 [Planctomycetota bacterium]|nr:hypothetical protein [Planctomycetota bacterium]